MGRLRLLEVRDEKFAVPLARFPLGRVGELNLAEAETPEEIAHLRHVVQRKHELAAQLLETFFEILEIRFAEIEPVEIPSPVRRIKVEEGRRPVKSGEDGFVRQTFDLDAGESPMSVLDEVPKMCWIETSRRLNGVGIAGVPDQSGLRVLLEVEEPRGALDVRERGRSLRFKERKPFPAYEDELQVPQELLIVQLADAEEIHDVGIEIVQHFRP